MAALVNVHNLAATGGYISQDVTEELVRCGHLHLHVRLQQDRLGTLQRCLKAQGTGHLKRHFRGVHRMGLPIQQPDLDVDHRIV